LPRVRSRIRTTGEFSQQVGVSEKPETRPSGQNGVWSRKKTRERNKNKRETLKKKGIWCGK